MISPGHSVEFERRYGDVGGLVKTVASLFGAPCIDVLRHQ